MRATHSIKGAARVVNLRPVEHLAHAMEDCFFALQHQRIELTTTRIDHLFQGVDLLESLTKIDRERLSEEVEKALSAITLFVDQLGESFAVQPLHLPPVTETLFSCQKRLQSRAKRERLSTSLLRMIAFCG